MQTKYTYKQIWLIAYPILISLLMEQLIGMTDTAFLGRVGEVELGASAIAGVFYMVIFMVAFGFSIGAQILIARRNGEQQYKEIGDLFYQGIYFQVGMAAVMFLLSYCFSPIILKRIVASEHIYEAATSYLHWRVFGAFFSFSAVMFRAFFLGTTQTKTLTLNSIVMVLSNVVFNYILISVNSVSRRSALPEPPSAPHWPSWFRCYSSSSIPAAASTAASTGWIVFLSSGWTY